MPEKKPIYVVGHRNPDTDSVCSAIAYARLKQALGVEDVVAARAGEINAETKYALETFRVDLPYLLQDIYPRVRDVMLPINATVSEQDSMRHLGKVMTSKKVLDGAASEETSTVDEATMTSAKDVTVTKVAKSDTWPADWK